MQSFKKLLFATLLVFITLGSSSIHAAAFDFSYDTGSGLIEFSIEGTLLADNNTVVVNSLLGPPSFDGASGPVWPFLTSVSNYTGLLPGETPKLTLDGSYADFLLCDSSDCDEGIYFAVNSPYAAAIGVDSLGVVSSAFGVFSQIYDQSAWQGFSNTTAVPVPAAFFLMATLLPLAVIRKKLNTEWLGQKFVMS